MKTTKQAKPLAVGNLVRVLPAFAGRDRFGRERLERDEFTGRVYYIMGPCGPNDFKLSSVPEPDRDPATGFSWEVIVHVSRLRRARVRRAA